MKKKWIIASLVLALAACSKENPAVETEGYLDASKLKFDFRITRADETKAVKTAWEKGDKIFFFFENISTAYVTMEFDGSSWVSKMNGTADFPVAGQKLTAVYLPYGAGLTPAFSGSVWTFNETQYSYYLVAENVAYSISNASNSPILYATVNMKNPEGFVHFYMADASSMDGAYTLATDAVIPVGLASVGINCTVAETNDKVAGSPIPGYCYNGGYSFSGKISASYSDFGTLGRTARGTYYFIKTKVSDGSREDYFFNTRVTVNGREYVLNDDNALKEHMAVVLPANGDKKWIAVGADKWVDLGNPAVEFATCNYGSTVPEDKGTSYSYNEIVDMNISIPTKKQFEWLKEDTNILWTWTRVNNIWGGVAKSKTTDKFMFLPVTLDIAGRIWSSDSVENDDSKAYDFRFATYFSFFGHGMGQEYKDTKQSLRPVRSK